MATESSNPYGSLTAEVQTAMGDLQADQSRYEAAVKEPRREAEELLRISQSVQIFFVGADGRCSTFSEPSDLRAFRLEASGDEPALVFLQVGGWSHPLLPDLCPVLEAANGAFMFPDVYADAPGASVGIVVLDGAADAEEKRGRVRALLAEHAALRTSEPLPLDQQLGSVGRVMVKGAEYVASGLEKGAEKACELIEYVGERQKAGTEPAQTDAKVNPALRYSVTGAKYATHATVKVSGFVATRVGNLTKRLSGYLASKIEKPVSGAVVGSGSGSGVRQSSSMRHLVDAARGGLLAYGTVYAGLEESAKVLGSSLKEQSVGVVEHRYGQDAGGVYGNAVTAAGNAAMTYMNVQSLGVKGLVKRTAKNTAKDVGKRVLDRHAEQAGH